MAEKMRVQLHGADATESFGEKIGARLKGGEVIELVSDLGGGKTTLVRGIAKGAGSTDRVTSPTFAVGKVYGAEKFALHHFDFYRLSSAGILEHELQDLMGDPDVVVVIEWGDIVHHVLPEKRISMVLHTTAEDDRELSIQYEDSLQYIFDGIET